MGIKDELKDCIRGRLGEAASPFFVNRALARIDEVESDMRSLMTASSRVVKMIRLFIDEQVAEEVMKALRLKIERAGLQ